MIESPYLTVEEACGYLRFVSADGTPKLGAFYTFRHRTKLKAFRRGGRLLFRRVDLDKVLYEERPELTIAKRRA
jgi:hypothetical protein